MSTVIPVEVTPDGRMKLRLHIGQARTWNSTRRFIWMLAGSQGGKTSFGPIWLWREIKMRGSGDYLAVTSSFDLFNLKMLPAMLDWFVTKMKWGRWHAGARLIELADPETGEFVTSRNQQMWARIILRSAASKEGLESTTAKAAWMDECGQDEFSLTVWEAVQRRLSIAQGRVLGTTTLYNEGWLKTECYDRWLAGDETHDIIQFASYLNPAFSKAEYDRMQKNMQSHKFLMFYRGEFAKPPGLIYQDFDKEMHVCAPFRVPLHWPRYYGVDFGAVNNCVLWAAKDPATDILYIIREVFEGDQTTEEHVRHQLELAGDENIIAGWGGAPGEKQQRMDWSRSGLTVKQPPVADVEGGIDRVTTLIKNNKIRVFDTCKGLLDDLGTYRRETDEAGNTLPTISQKRHYHHADALRYLASGFLGQRMGKKAQVRVMDY